MNAVSTPRRPASNGLQRSAYRTPGSKTPYGNGRLHHSNRVIRHNVLTPGRERRRSGVGMIRKTPRDDLRALSRVLKPLQPLLPSRKRSSIVQLQEQIRKDAQKRLSTSRIISDNENEKQIPELRQASVKNTHHDDDDDDGEKSDGSEEFLSASEDNMAIEYGRQGLELRRRSSVASLSMYDDQLEQGQIKHDGDRYGRRRYNDRIEEQEFVIKVDNDDYNNTMGEYNVDGHEILSNHDDDGDDDDKEEEGFIRSSFGQFLLADNEGVQPARPRETIINQNSIPDKRNQAKNQRSKKKKLINLLPGRLIKDLARNLSPRLPVTPDGINAINTVSNQFFKQVGDDMARFAQHASRKTIEESDAMLLLRRQRQVNSKIKMFGLAHKYLPTELLAEMAISTANNKTIVKSQNGPRMRDTFADGYNKFSVCFSQIRET
ncbi:centromere kinetochore component CENP-T-domain-containing protein [Lipomyces japonicus]|uniref:centromere kinetochore component CENP-T-domain-containing protein n=1 Tax=Lipomyces japonicus TaxID=56871 RepID=UPI0034CEB6D7